MNLGLETSILILANWNHVSPGKKGEVGRCWGGGRWDGEVGGGLGRRGGMGRTGGLGTSILILAN